MRLRWTMRAADDLEQIKDFLLLNRPAEAQSTVITIYDRIRTLKRMPNRGRPGRLDGTRELVLAPLPYVVVYRVTEESVDVIRIHHGARNWMNPPILDRD